MKRLAMIAALLAMTGAFAQERAGETAKTEMKEAPALNWEQAPLDIVLQAYCEQLGKTYLKDPGTPNATISLKSREGQTLTQEEYLEAIEVVLEMNGVHIEPYGEKFIRVIPRAKARKVVGMAVYMSMEDVPKETKDGTVVSVRLTFKYIGTEEAQKALEGFKSDSGLLQIFERTNSILVTDTWENIKRMYEVIRSIDLDTPVTENVFIRQIKNASAQEIKQALEAIVQESQKELEKNKTANNVHNNGFNAGLNGPRFNPVNSPASRLLNRNQPQPQQPNAVNESQIMSVSDADRGMIRGRVLILADERSNKLVIVTSDANMKFFDKVIEQLDIETTPDTVVKVYRLKYADAEDVSDMINDLIGNSSKSSSGKGNQNANARNGAGSNLTRSNPATPAPKSANQRTGEAKAGELTKDNTTVLADKRINGIVVMTEKDLVKTIESIIESMDVKLAQVLIETVIIEVTLGDSLRTGIDWVQNGRYRTDNHETRKRVGPNGFDIFNFVDGKGNVVQRENVYPDGTFTDKDGNTWTKLGDALTDTIDFNILNKKDFWNGTAGYAAAMGGGANGGSAAAAVAADVATNLFGSAFNYIFKSDKLNLSAIIRASKDDNRSKYIASPVVMTVDNKEATIEATETRKFYSGSSANSSGYNAMLSYNYSDKDIGIKIKTTPKINPNGTVMLTIEEEYSQLGPGQNVLVSGQNGTAKEEHVDTALQRKMSADVLLDNMQTVVLGGLTETKVEEYESGIPILKDIPWIGKWLFGSVENVENRKELLVFMTPYVLDDGEAAQAEAIRRKKALSDANAWDDHGWSASPLADPVSKKEQLRRLKDEWKKQDEERKTRITIEEEKVNRVKHLKEMDEEERNLWLERHKKELEEERQEELEKKMEDPESQEELKKLAEKIREKKLLEAEKAQKKSLDDQKQKIAEGEAAEKAAREEKEEKEKVE